MILHILQICEIFVYIELFVLVRDHWQLRAFGSFAENPKQSAKHVFSSPLDRLWTDTCDIYSLFEGKWKICTYRKNMLDMQLKHLHIRIHVQLYNALGHKLACMYLYIALLYMQHICSGHMCECMHCVLHVQKIGQQLQMINCAGDHIR